MGNAQSQPKPGDFLAYCKSQNADGGSELELLKERSIEFELLVEIFTETTKQLPIESIIKLTENFNRPGDLYVLSSVGEDLAVLLRDIFLFRICATEENTIVQPHSDTLHLLLLFLVHHYSSLSQRLASAPKPKPLDANEIRKQAFREFQQRRQLQNAAPHFAPAGPEGPPDARNLVKVSANDYYLNLHKYGNPAYAQVYARDLERANPAPKEPKRVKTLADLKDDPSDFRAPVYKPPPEPVKIKDDNPKLVTMFDIGLKVKKENQRILGYACFDLTNDYRKSKGLPLLRWNEDVFKICLEHSENMARHVVPFGHQGFENRIKKLPYYSAAYENVAYIAGVSDKSMPRDIVNGWIMSPGHRKNMESGSSHSAVAAFATEHDSTYYFTQIFILM